MSFTSYRIISFAEEETVEKLKTALSILNAAIKNPEWLSLNANVDHEKGKVPFKSRHVTRMLKKCLVNHRFIEAAKIMECLSCETDSNHLIFRAGFHVLENHPHTINDTVPNFVRYIMKLSCVHKSEIILELIIYFIKHQRFQEARQSLQDLTVSKHRYTFQIDPLIEGLLSAYGGLLNYVEWIHLQRLAKDNIDDSENAYCEEQHMIKWAEKAIQTFTEIISHPGQWDIFVLKLIEILEYYKRLNEAEDALIKYAELNPEHINANIYLYEFYKKHSYEREKQLTCLQTLITKCPSNDRVLEYISLIKNEEKNLVKYAELLLNYLNYASNKNNLNAWKLFVDILLNIFMSENKEEIVQLKNEWRQYKGYWPSYQFSVMDLTISDDNSAMLAIQKAIAFVILKENCKDYPYVENVRERLIPYSSLLLEFNKKMDEISCIWSKI